MCQRMPQQPWRRAREEGSAVIMSTALPIVMHGTVLSYWQLLHLIRGLLYAGEYSIIGAAIYLVVCCIGCQISLSQALLLHEASVEYVKRYFV